MDAGKQEGNHDIVQGINNFVLDSEDQRQEVFHFYLNSKQTFSQKDSDIILFEMKNETIHLMKGKK